MKCYKYKIGPCRVGHGGSDARTLNVDDEMDISFFRCGTILVFHRQTDRQTGGQTDRHFDYG